MSDARLKSGLLVQAAVRLCSRRGVPAVVARRGDGDAGAIHLLIDRLDGRVTLLARAREGDGRLAWRPSMGGGPVTPAEAQEWLAREARIDPDIWIVEIEDREGRNPFEMSV